MNMLFKDKDEDTKSKSSPEKKGLLDKLKNLSGGASVDPNKAPKGGSLNPFKWSKEVQEFLDFVNRVTDGGKKKPSPEEFEQIVSAYKSLNAIQRYSASSKLAAENPAMDAAVRGNNYGLLELNEVL